MSSGREYDAVVVGASLAGCSTAMLLARAGSRVALVERSPDPDAFKRMCSHFIQSSAVPTLERLGLLGPMERAGATRSRMRLWTPWGRIHIDDSSRLPRAVNLRREKLDPMLRRMAGDTPGVELMLGEAAVGVVRDGARVRGVEVRDRGGRALTLRGRLVVGADGRDSALGKLAGVRTRTRGHGRFAYGAYFEGPPPAGAPDGTVWMLDPQWAAAFPTDDGLTFYGCMGTKDRLPEFRRDLEGTFTRFMTSLPDAPPIDASRRVGAIIGKL